MLAVDLIWTGASGENYANAMAWDGTYIYVGLLTDPPVLIRLNPSTMVEVDRWTGASGEDSVNDIMIVGNHVYVATEGTSGNGEVIKLNKSDLTESARWAGDANSGNTASMTNDGTYLYVSTSSSSLNKVVKVPMSNMVEIATLTGTNKKFYYGLTFDGTYIYAGVYDRTASPTYNCLLEKIGTSMSILDTFTEVASTTYNAVVDWDGTYLYLGVPTSPAKVIKLSTALAEQDRWTGASGENKVTSFAIGDTGELYTGLQTVPGVIKLATSTMDELERWADGLATFGLAFDGNNAFVALLTAPAKVVKLATVLPTSKAYLID